MTRKINSNSPRINASASSTERAEKQGATKRVDKADDRLVKGETSPVQVAPQIPALITPGNISQKDVDAACRQCEAQLAANGLPSAKVGFLSKGGVECEEVAQLLADTFVQAEPMARAMAQHHPQTFSAVMLTFSRELTNAMAEGGLTAIAKAQGHVVGLLMASPFVHGKEGEPSELPPPELAPIFRVLEQLEEAFAPARERTLKEIELHSDGNAAARAKLALSMDGIPPVVDLAMAATHRNYQGKHIGELLVPVVLTEARRKGFGEVIAKATSNSQKILARQGLKVLAEVPYGTFTHEGTKPFAAIPHPRSAQLMWTFIAELGKPAGSRL